MAVVIGVLVVLVLVGAAVYDARARRKGHRLRSSGDMTRSERDVQRNVRASDGMLGGAPIDDAWYKPDDQRGFRGD